jgi:hypothetical protein
MVGLVAAGLVFWEPLRFAVEASMVFGSLSHRGTLAAIELVVHGLIAALSAAAGLALRNSSPDGRRLALLAITACVARVVQSLYWSALPNNTRPGDELLIVGVAVVFGTVAAVSVSRVSRTHES